MERQRPWQSVVMKMVAGLVLGGLVLGLGLGALDYRRGATELRLNLTHRLTYTTRNLQNVLRSLFRDPDVAEIQMAMQALTADPAILAVRVVQPQLGSDGLQDVSPYETGYWQVLTTEPAPAIWQMPEYGTGPGMGAGLGVDLDRLTLLRAPFQVGHQIYQIEMLVDGPGAQTRLRAGMFARMREDAVMFTVIVLLGLLMLRRWFAGPLARILQMLRSGSGSKAFLDAARRQQGEFHELCVAMGQMLGRIDSTSRELRDRERRLHSLYHHAPTALLSIDPAGVITEANHRADQLLGVERPGELIGRSIWGLIAPVDQPRLQQTMARLADRDWAKCEMRLEAPAGRIDVAVEVLGLRDDDRVLESMRLSLADVSEARAMQRATESDRREMNLLIDHLPEGVVLVDLDDRVVTVNRSLAQFLRRRLETLPGQKLCHETFWESMRPANPPDWAARLTRLARLDRSGELGASDRFSTMAGEWEISVTPVRDRSGRTVGRLYVLRDLSSAEQLERVRNEQNRQLQKLKQIGRALNDLSGVDTFLKSIVRQLHVALEVEVVGIAVRGARSRARTVHLMHRGPLCSPLHSSREWLAVLERHLIPEVLRTGEVAFWSDLQRRESWARAASAAGFTSLAVAPLQVASDQSQGVLWVARRGGEQLDRNQLYLLETLTPLLAARLQIAQLGEKMRELDLVDRVTGLPNHDQFEYMLQRLGRRSAGAWSLLLVHLDQLGHLNDRIGHAGTNRLLATAAGALQRGARHTSHLFRLDGPVFAVLWPDNDAQDAQALAERLRQIVHHLPSPEGWEPRPDEVFRCTASIGGARTPADGLLPIELVEIARQRLLKAKAAGRDCWVLSDPDEPKCPADDHRKASMPILA